MKMFFIAAAVVSLSAGVAQAQDKTYILSKSDMHVPADNLMSGPGFQEKIDLGRQLFFDPRLSSTGTVSCNSCHNVMAGGEDSVRTSTGVKGQLGGRNSPTVWNSAFHSVQFWDGRANLLEDQAKGPVTNPIEMGMKDHSMAVARLQKIDGYRDSFAKVFGGKASAKDVITIDKVAKAIAAYERTLVTENSPFDRFNAGDVKALSADAKKGWETFQKTGCVACHSGAHFSGPKMPIGTGFYQKFPLMPDANIEKAYGFSKDLGRFDVTKNEADKNTWRVPTLRNIALTAPYFHNGAVADLSEAVRVMGKVQLGKDLSKSEIKSIVAFLNSLTGEFPKQEMPRLPAYPNSAFVD